MNGFLLAMDLDGSMPIEGVSDKLVFGGEMLLMGVLTVFLVLGIIWFALSILKIVFVKQKQPKKKQAEMPVQATVPTALPADEELVCAIMAAIACAESECSDTKFRVVSFKKR
jgi:Na+-transporting methylmalonyl-CoA/oxaloacetate decarboxylase gamma subunit